MFLSYNGVLMDVIATDEVTREFVYSPDETQLLYTTWTIPVVALLNPHTAFGNGQTVVAADKYAMALLQEPRKKLILFEQTKDGAAGGLPDGFGGFGATPSGGRRPFDTSRVPSTYEVILESPVKRSGDSIGPSVDAKDGPTPLQYNISAISGTNNWLVRFVVRTHVSPDPLSSGEQPSPIGSHRWRMSFSTTPEYYAVRVIEGMAIFRKDRLEVSRLKQDDFRAMLAHPIPRGYKRMPPIMSLSEDGTVLTYHLEDVEQATTLNAAGTGVVHAEVSESVEYSRPSLGILGIGGATPVGPGGWWFGDISRWIGRLI